MTRQKGQTGKTARTGGLTGLLIAFWLSLAVLPCAVAVEIDHDCPHCPPEHEQDMAAHHGHQDAAANPDCVSLQADCCELDDALRDSRGANFQGDPDDSFVHASDPPWYLPARADRRESAARPPDPFPSPTPLHVLYCVYLD